VCRLRNIAIFISFLHFIQYNVRKCSVQDDRSIERAVVLSFCSGHVYGTLDVLSFGTVI
jgi:hypothetical protein